MKEAAFRTAVCLHQSRKETNCPKTLKTYLKLPTDRESEHEQKAGKAGRSMQGPWETVSSHFLAGPETPSNPDLQLLKARLSPERLHWNSHGGSLMSSSLQTFMKLSVYCCPGWMERPLVEMQQWSYFLLLQVGFLPHMRGRYWSCQLKWCFGFAGRLMCRLTSWLQERKFDKEEGGTRTLRLPAE